MNNNKNKDDDLDITRIEDLPPLDHPPLPELPKLPDPPIFEQATLPHEEFIPFNQEHEVTANINVDVQEEPLHFENPIEPVKNEPIKTATEEIFEDVKTEMETFVLKHVPFESYPSYSLYITQVQNGHQRNAIRLLLKEFQLLQNEAELQLVNRSLQLNHLLIPRISEYAAIYFANKLENYHLKIQFSPSEDLTGHHEFWDQGPLTQESFNHHKEEQGIIYPEIFMSQAFSIADKKVILLGEVLQQTFTIENSELENISIYFKNLTELKDKARNLSANAIVGINFQQLQGNNQQTTIFLVTGEAAKVHDV